MENKLAVSTIVSSVYELEGVFSDAYGYKVFDKHPLAKLDDNGLHLGNYEIADYDIDFFKSKIPLLYCVRNVSNSGFVCGLDLIDDGKVWVGVNAKKKSYFDNINDAMNFVKDEDGNDCFICLEGEMRF